MREDEAEVIPSVDLYEGSNIRDESKGLRVPMGKGFVGSSFH